MKALRAILVVASLLGATAAHGDDWGEFANVSATLGINGSRVCVGEGTRGDLGCPTYAPSITTSGDVSVTGNLSAAKFIGDGSGLTGLATTPDKITSGTTNVTVNSATNSISFSTAGSQQMTITGNGRVGIGTSTPAKQLDVVGSISASGVVLAVTGTSAAPGFSFQGNTSSGMYMSNTNILSFARAGTEFLSVGGGNRAEPDALCVGNGQHRECHGHRNDSHSLCHSRRFGCDQNCWLVGGYMRYSGRHQENSHQSRHWQN